MMLRKNLTLPSTHCARYSANIDLTPEFNVFLILSLIFQNQPILILSTSKVCSFDLSSTKNKKVMKTTCRPKAIEAFLMLLLFLFIVIYSVFSQSINSGLLQRGLHNADGKINIAEGVNEEVKATPLNIHINGPYAELKPALTPMGTRLYFSRALHPQNSGGGRAGPSNSRMAAGVLTATAPRWRPRGSRCWSRERACSTPRAAG
jgi:hypothetical protein